YPACGTRWITRSAFGGRRQRASHRQNLRSIFWFPCVPGSRHVGGRVEETVMRLNTVGFIVTLVLLTLWAPLAADAQQPVKVPLIGVLGMGFPPSEAVRQQSPFWQKL